jgi:sulfatase maturation enzyme AslB (radical SAM superfamily)
MDVVLVSGSLPQNLPWKPPSPQRLYPLDFTKSLQDAKSAINDFHKRTDGKEAYVIFYGGEPLLEFGLIKEIVSHANTIGRGIFKYSLTTNGVSLTPDKFDFLISNKFLVTVSVDGPSKVHDKMRISKNKKGSHSIVENNISQLKNYCESFYELNVRVNCTIFDKSDIDAIDSYFENNRLFHRESLRFSPALQSEGEVDRYMSLLQNPDYGFDFSRQEAKL